MSNIDLSSLSALELDSLMRLAQIEKKKADAIKRSERVVYDELKDELVQATYKKLVGISVELQAVKAQIFSDFEEIMKMKKYLFELSDEQLLVQGSHTFTTADGLTSIIIGSNIIDRWDETASVGIDLVNKWMESLARDENSTKMVGIIRDLLKPNKDGVLKANRVLDLSRKAYEMDDSELIKATDIIRQAYRPAKTTTYVKAKMKDPIMGDIYVPLSLSSV